MKLIIAVAQQPVMEKNLIEFMAPEGMELPEGVQSGDTFEVMATVQLGEEGELYLKEIDGMPVSSESEDESEEVEEEGAEEEQDVSEGGFLEAMERRVMESER